MDNLKSIILIEKYLNDELGHEARMEVEAKMMHDAAFLELFEVHVSFLKDLQGFNQREKFRAHLGKAGQAFQSQTEIQKTAPEANRSFMRRLMPQQEQKVKNLNVMTFVKFNLVSAAVVAIIAVFSTLWLSGYYKNMQQSSSYYKELRRDVNAVKLNVNAHNAAIKNINEHNNVSVNNFGATGFMLSVDGFIVTNNHVITGADSIHLQNAKGETFQAQIVFTDAQKDLAILMITDSTFVKPRSLPYSLKESISELGEDVYTLGYPRDEAVYGQGYLSSMSGYDGDTTAYQISIPVNPGNSGGPLLDAKGNIIGIISGKQSGLDGTSFAIKAKSILDLVDQIPDDVLATKIKIQKKNNLAGLKRTEQLNKLKDYVYLVKVF